jgi:hypothetical protein
MAKQQTGRAERQKRRITFTNLSYCRRPDGEVQYKITVPAWVVKQVLQAKAGDRLEWDFLGSQATIKKIGGD